MQNSDVIEIPARRSRRSASALARGGARSHSRYFYTNFQDRDALAVLQPDLDLLRSHFDMLGDYAQNFLAQNRNEPRMTGRGPLVREQNLQALAREWGGAPLHQKPKQIHAALLPKSRLNKFCRPLGMVMGTDSPFNRRAASV
jgi:hypothetical protein